MPTPTGDVAHLLRRAGFGAHQSVVKELSLLDIRAIVDRVLAVSAAPPVVKPANVGNDGMEYQQWVSMTQWWLERMRTTPAPLVEKMALFWHGHLCSGIEKVGSPIAMWNQNQLFRTKGLGSFVDLVQSVAIDPAMLVYLDNTLNEKGAPNENFARELMELFTLGVNQYTQDDIIASARAWTGHGINRETYTYTYDGHAHDDGSKMFFGMSKRWTGPQIVEEILLGKKKEISARFLATKLWAFFAYPGPEPAVLDAIVAPYLASNLNIAALVKAIFLRPEFYSTKAKRGLVRSPIEYMVATMKGLNLPADKAHPEWFCEPMGQVPFNPPNVSGWRPNGYWISSSSTWAKMAWANYVRWQVDDGPVLAGIRSLSPEESVKTTLRQFGIDRAGPTTTSALRRYVERERTSDRWAERPNMILLALMSPEMQLA